MNWRNLLPSTDPRSSVKGAELARAIVPGTLSRFLLVDVRAIEADGQLGHTYRVHDAFTVSDAQVREGITSKAVRTIEDLEGAVSWCQREAGYAA